MSVLWWFLVALHLGMLHGWLGSLGVQVVDAGAVLALFLGFHARLQVLPLLLVAAGVGRGVLLAGSPALHVLVLGLPVAVLLPLRTVFFRRQWFWQVLAAGFLVLILPRIGEGLSRLLRQPSPPPAPSWWQVLAAAVVVPVVVALLIRLAPLRACVERHE